MQPDPNTQQAIDLAIRAHPWVAGLFNVGGGAYVLAWVLGLGWSRAARIVLWLGVAAHLAGTIGRGWIIEFFPLTNKFESFSAAALCTALVAASTWSGRRLYDLPLLGVALAALATAARFSPDLVFAPPLMRTIWYPLHVPLSFLSYGFWVAAGCASLAWFDGRDPRWLRRVDRFMLRGFGLWSLSMIAGGLWGVVAWGAYFLWDPKVIWSVILWLHYATALHVRLTPSLVTRPWVRPLLALVGALFVFIAYVGTSFFFGASSHAF